MRETGRSNRRLGLGDNHFYQLLTLVPESYLFPQKKAVRLVPEIFHFYLILHLQI